jgi:hypothetical protein
MPVWKDNILSFLKDITCCISTIESSTITLPPDLQPLVLELEHLVQILEQIVQALPQATPSS